jgi:hypothetical protein
VVTHGVNDGPTEKRELDIVTLKRKYVNSATLEKKCGKCEKIFPRNSDYFYSKPHRTNKDAIEYNAVCITCDNDRALKWKKNNKKTVKRISDTYRNSERGYFMELWQSTKKSKHGNEFESFDDFFSHWVEQQKIYGTRCPYLNIEMTRIKGRNIPGTKTKTCPTNISRDRINSSLPYSRKNLMFCSWEANDRKGSVTPLIAKRYLGFYRERFGNDY